MPKRRLRKARHLIKKYQDSWGSLEHKFKHRQRSDDILKEETAEIGESSVVTAIVLPATEYATFTPYDESDVVYD